MRVVGLGGLHSAPLPAVRGFSLLAALSACGSLGLMHQISSWCFGSLSAAHCAHFTDR